MSSINISEDDFMAVTSSAHLAKSSGDINQAKILDKLARKMNASLSNKRAAQSPFGRVGKPLTWQDVPSVFDE